MGFHSHLWTRLEFMGTPVYVRPDKPDWFVPNRAGDRVLRRLSDGYSADGDVGVLRFLQRLPDEPATEYPGRAAFLATEQLSELWLHITNRCDSNCSHCLFASSPSDKVELSSREILEIAHQGWALGCRVFALTGGEPLFHRDFEGIVDGLLTMQGTNVVILTSGTLLTKYREALLRWDRDRLFLQIGLDGLRENHDRTRGRGAFDHLMEQLSWLRAQEIPFTVAMCVTNGNVRDIPRIIDLSADVGASNVHFIWYFIRGRGDRSGWVNPDTIFEPFVQAAVRAEQRGIGLDNIDALKSQVFAPPGTKHDGSGSGWDSLAVGPDGKLYPSPALIGIEALATEINGNLAAAWKNTPLLERLRLSTAAAMSDPLRFILGGGDCDHSYMHSGEFVGNDPYSPLLEKTALWLIAREASHQSDEGPPRLRLKMGDILESCGAHGPVASIHSNCLLAVANVDGHTAVKEFYAHAARDRPQDIRNPICYPEVLIEHVPESCRLRSYGCGSPVVDADLKPGECVVDLGCGTGVECFVAARMVGKEGSVIGVDMLDPMLELARSGAEKVASRLGYVNLEFRKGYLEQLPLQDNSVDVALSNCVVNLSTNKRRTFGEIWRVLRNGGRLVISDVVCETEPDPGIRNDEVLRGECIAGALTQRDLFGLLEESGFVSARILKRFPYRAVRGHTFFSMTFEAYKPVLAETIRVMYRGPAAAILAASGALLPAGRTCEIPATDLLGAGEELFRFDTAGRVTNVEIGDPCNCGCACISPPESSTTEDNRISVDILSEAIVSKQRSVCKACGAPLQQHPDNAQARCLYCGE